MVGHHLQCKQKVCEDTEERGKLGRDMEAGGKGGWERGSIWKALLAGAYSSVGS